MRAARCVATLVALFACCFAARAQAFCRTTTCDPATEDCAVDSPSHGCITSGLLLYWSSGCVSYSVQGDGSKTRDISYTQIHQIMQNAFSTWENADCGSGATPSIHLADYSPVVCDHPVYNQSSPNANVVMFRDADWPYMNAIDTLALTTVTFNTQSGEIYDADIEINSFENSFQNVELAGVLTHEAGHFLGLSHENLNNQATMRKTYAPGLATLDADDVAGICDALPPGRTPSSEDCTPRHGFSSECTTAKSKGCLTTAVGARPAGSQALALLGVLLGLGLNQRRRARRAGRRARS